MIAKALIDTNVLLYAAAGKHDFPAKYQKAWDLLSAGEFGLSAQVLAEFYVNAVRKPSVPLTPSQVDNWLVRLSDVPVVAIDQGIVLTAINFSRRFHISYWDGAILAAAHRLEAKVVYSEDLSHQQMYGGVQVINPFV
jgi:predicted nucleic acid-binding protein